MFCPKCGNEIKNDVQVCSRCGANLSLYHKKETERVSAVVVTSDKQDERGESTNQVIKVLYFGVAIIVLLMFFVAANNISKGGDEIMQIESVGGRTLEEAYYAELGAIYSGYATIARALGIFCASVLVWLGIKK